jgi:hypothetical protein
LHPARSARLSARAEIAFGRQQLSLDIVKMSVVSN